MAFPGPPLPTQVQIRDEERPRGLRERLAALRYLPALVGLVWQTNAGLTVAMVVLRLTRAFLDEHHASPARAAPFRRAATTSTR